MTRYHEEAVAFIGRRLTEVTKERDEALAKLAKARDLLEQIDTTHDLRCSACYLEDSGKRSMVPNSDPRCDCGLRELVEAVS